MSDRKSSPDDILSANEAGKILGVSGKTIIRMMEDGDFPGYKIGVAWKFKRGEIEQYLESRRFQGGRKKSATQEDAEEVA